MIKVYFATKLRGFFKHLQENQELEIDFITKENYYELVSNKKKLILKIFRSKIFNHLGIIRQIRCDYNECDYIGSFNRFIKSKKPYFIYVENPTALYEYCLGRNKSYLGKKRIHKLLMDTNLTHLICMSEACKNTMTTLLGQIPGHIDVQQIYPYVPENTNINREEIKKKCWCEKVSCLYIAQSTRFVSKGGLEIIEVFKKFERDRIDNVVLNIVTDYKNLDAKIVKEIEQSKNINLIDFKLTYKELEKLYAETSILLHPTSDDSFGLTVLEAIKGGATIISTKLYAIPEMVKEAYNGYLIEPKYWFFNKDNIPNPKVWNNREKTIYSNAISNHMVEEVYNLVIDLENNRKKLEEMCNNSLELANSEKFSCKSISNKWNNMFK